MNDAAKAFFHADPPREDLFDLPNLRVWAPTAGYMLAMKCIAARFDSHDLDDVKFLIEYLHLRKPDDVFRIVERYYPKRMIPPKRNSSSRNCFLNRRIRELLWPAPPYTSRQVSPERGSWIRPSGVMRA